jgi:hypothetical protein
MKRWACVSRTGRQCRPPPAAASGTTTAAIPWRQRLHRALGEAFFPTLRRIARKEKDFAVRLLGGTHVGYAKLTRRWWQPIEATLHRQGLVGRPTYFISSNLHSVVNLVSGLRATAGQYVVEFPRAQRPDRSTWRSSGPGCTAVHPGADPGQPQPVLRRCRLHLRLSRGHPAPHPDPRTAWPYLKPDRLHTLYGFTLARCCGRRARFKAKGN